MLSAMTSNDDARVDTSAATSKPRRHRKPQQSSRVVSDLVESALAAKQQEERALAAQTRHHRKRAFRKPKGLKQHLGGAGGADAGADAGGDTSSCQPPDVCSASSGAGITNGSDSDAFVVVLENLVDPEELEDSDEYDDVVADLESDFQSYGDLVSLRVSRETGFIALQLANSDSADAVVREKHGKLFGGRQVVARLVQREEGNPPPVTVPSPPSHTIEASPYKETETQAQTQDANVDPVAQKKKKKKRRTKCKNAVLREREKTEPKPSTGLVGSAGSRDVARCEFIVCNLIASDEIEDEDEFEELQSDTRADFEKFGALTHLEVATRGHDSVDDIFHQHDPTTTGANLIANPGNVVVEYAHPDCAAAAFWAYNGRVFGGRMVECHWVSPALSPANSISTTSILVENMLSPEELEDDDEFEDIRDEVADLFARHGAVQSLVISRPSGTITVVYEALEAAQQAVAKMNQSVYGGRSVKVSLLANGGDDGDHNESQKDEPDGKPDRPFVTTTMQSEAVETVVQFLKRLASLQERAHQQNPLQDKRSRRLVLGLHEVKRGLLSKKIRLLIVATDVEECGMLDEKLAEILAIAKRDQVPVAFPMTRRKLGRVLSKNVRVSCVGVYSFEGVNELFAQITRNVSTGASAGS